jgi:hypothetical protein
MGDWEQPSTSLEGALAAKAGGGEDPIQLLRQQVAAAVVRIEELERRVSDLERRADENRGQAQGA